MKKILSLFFILITAISSAQHKEYLLSNEGIGSLKIGMPLSELEKLLQKKINLKVIGVDPVVLVETVKVTYKGINVEINLIKRQDYIAVDGITSNSPICKTKSGIGIGSTKLQIINAFEGYYIDLIPGNNSEGGHSIKKNIRGTVTVIEDEEGDAIVFSLKDNKVVSFSIYPIFDDEEG